MEHIDRLIATDVVYSRILVDNLAKLIRAVKQKNPDCAIEVVIPSGRSTQQDFLISMQAESFSC